MAYLKILRKAKGIERGLKMVPILIHLPTAPGTQNTSEDSRAAMRERVVQAQSLYDLIAGTAMQGFKSRFYGQRHIALELVAKEGLVHYYAAVPVALVSIIEKAILTAYPGAKLEHTEDYNIFNADSKLAGACGGELTLKAKASYPIATFETLERDPMEAILNVLSSLDAGEGAALQILLRPAGHGWVKRAENLAKKVRLSGGRVTGGLSFTATDLAKAAIKPPKGPVAGAPLAGLDQAVVEGIENKTRHPGFETLIRAVASAPEETRAKAILYELVSTFTLYENPGSNGFKFLPANDVSGLVTAYIFRFFPPELRHDILNSQELATVFHLPDAVATVSSGVQRQYSKQVDGPAGLPQQGLVFGHNDFRDTKKEIRLSAEDRRRHTYIIGQTGTGKSTLLENLAVQDMLAGGGLAFIDPHGDTAERLIGMVPKERSEDIIYFNPSDTDYPLGLNLFEFSEPEQKDFLIQEAIGMLYKLYDPGHTGIIGPRYEHWFRNAALTLMSDPAGATFIEVPKVFTDPEYLKTKFKYLQDPTVIDFWTKEMASTSDYHKSEMLGWFVSKFGAFSGNTIMRNIIGQPKSAFNLREVMDQKKILIINLSKGKLGELNSQLLGMMLVIKFQAAAMSRADADSRPDFCLYVDEFQNFSTDSFASILSEARKYGLNLIVANQFIGQLTPAIRDAVFGNVGTMLSFRAGPEDAEFLVKQFAPAFDAHDVVNLPNFSAIMRLMIGGLPSQPFSLATLPPLARPNPELALAVKQLSAAKYGHAKAQIEAEILARLGSGGASPASQAKPVTPPTAVDTRPADMAASAAQVPPPVAPRAEVTADARPAAATSSATAQAPLITPSATLAAAPARADLSATLNAKATMAPAAAKTPGELSIQDIVKDMPPAVSPPTQATTTVKPLNLNPNTVEQQGPRPILNVKPGSSAVVQPESEEELAQQIASAGLDGLIQVINPKPASPQPPAALPAQPALAADPVCPPQPAGSLPPTKSAIPPTGLNRPDQAPEPAMATTPQPAQTSAGKLADSVTPTPVAPRAAANPAAATIAPVIPSQALTVAGPKPDASGPGLPAPSASAAAATPPAEPVKPASPPAVTAAPVATVKQPIKTSPMPAETIKPAHPVTSAQPVVTGGQVTWPEAKPGSSPVAEPVKAAPAPAAIVEPVAPAAATGSSASPSPTAVPEVKPAAAPAPVSVPTSVDPETSSAPPVQPIASPPVAPGTIGAPPINPTTATPASSKPAASSIAVSIPAPAAKPNVAPGEVFVDEHGNVHMAEA